MLSHHHTKPTTRGHTNTEFLLVNRRGAITSWEIDGETVADFILGGSKITLDGDCTREIKKDAYSLEGKL